MGTQTISVEFPDEIDQRLQEMATATHRPVEEILAQTIRGNLPLTPDDLPPAQQDLVTDLALLDDNTLWAVAREALPASNWRRHRHLLRKANTDALTPVEGQELSTLREATDRFVTRRSVALALLKWRGHTLPIAP